MAVNLFSIGRFTVHGYGLMIGLGFAVAVLLGSRQAEKDKLSGDHFINIAMWVLVIGFLGGKLLNVIVNFKVFLQNPMSVLGSEGFVVYVGIITGILAIYAYCHIKKLDFFKYFDLFAVFVPINQAFGRLGCFMAGCCYGRVSNSRIGVVFPVGLFGSQRKTISVCGVILSKIPSVTSKSFSSCSIYSLILHWASSSAAEYSLKVGTVIRASLDRTASTRRYISSAAPLPQRI